MTSRVFGWNYPALEQKITFSQCRKFLRALPSFAPVRRGGQVYTSLREEKIRRGGPAILRGRLQRRQAAKSVRRGGKSYQADHNFFARKKNSSQSRKDAKDLSDRISGTIPLYLYVLSAAAF